MMMESNIYFDHTFSLGSAYNMQDHGEDDVDFFPIRSKYFIHSNFAVGRGLFW
ncbi:hypothetical protein [Acinetobacter sp. TSRC1-2]|uniref:hypothetical protein n=1 Tax=unclassified Acinetobacter TaxID=196816 RepID=UPI003CF44BFC